MFKLIKNAISFSFFCVLVLSIYAFMRKEVISERFLSKYLNTRVSVQKVAFKDNKLIFRNVSIYNLLHSNMFPIAVKIDSIALDLAIANSISNAIITINKISVLGASFNLFLYTRDGSENNWNNIIKQIQRSQYEARKVVIHKYEIDKISVNGIKANGKELPSFEIDKLKFNRFSASQYSAKNPTIEQAVSSLLCLPLEQISNNQYLHAILQDNISQLNEAHMFFEIEKISHIAKLRESFKKVPIDGIRDKQKSQQESLMFLRELFFR